MGWYEGTGKYSGLLGALVCQTSDGLLQVRVGTGLKDNERNNLISYMGKVITVRYNQIVKGNGDRLLLYLPRFIGVRYDKDVPDALDEL